MRDFRGTPPLPRQGTASPAPLFPKRSLDSALACPTPQEGIAMLIHNIPHKRADSPVCKNKGMHTAYRSDSNGSSRCLCTESPKLMGQARKTFKAIPQATLRRLRNTPGYIFILWRWVAWLYALIWLISIHAQPNPNLAILLLGITLLQTLVVTLYAPVFQIFLPGLPGMRKAHRRGQQQQQRRIWGRRRPRPLAADEEADIRTPFASTRNPYWDIGIYGLDVVICGLVTYYGGLFGSPHFGDGSPFYRFGISTALAAAFTYRYRGGLAAALGYDSFILFGAFFPPTQIPYDALSARDLAGSLLDAPVIAILAAYMASLLESYTRSKRREQDNVRLQIALRRVGETLIQDVSDVKQLLQQSAEQLRKGGHFERLVIALVRNAHEAKES